MLVYMTRAGNTSDIIALDAVSSVSVSRTGTPSRQTLQDGVSVADHYIASLPTVTFSGLITNSKLPNRNAPTVTNFVNWVNELMDSGATFTLYGDDSVGIPTLYQCVITSFSYDKTASNLNSLAVNMTVEQLDFGLISQLSNINTTASSSTNGQTNDKTSSTSGTKTYENTSARNGDSYFFNAVRRIDALEPNTGNN